MIISKFKGGIGNQLFIVAYLLSKYPNKKVIWDLSYYRLQKRIYAEKSYHTNFVLESLFLDSNKKWSFNNIGLGRFIVYLFMLLNQIGFEKHVHLIREKKNFNNTYSNQGFSHIDGHWINPVHALNVKSQIQDRINNVERNLSRTGTELLTLIRESSSVSIHYRGNQYINDEKIKSTYFIPKHEYFKKAISVIKNKIEKPLFFIFSNNENQAKEYFKDYDCKKIFVDETIPDYEAFYLMSKCYHNIINTSTFSWWAAVLNPSQESTVICPKTWTLKKELKSYNDLALDQWIKI